MYKKYIGHCDLSSLLVNETLVKHSKYAEL